MNSQEIVEQQIRMVLGDLHVQLIMARAKVAELEQQLAKAEVIPAKPNGRAIEPELPLEARQ
jgi:hypothetical protein